MGCSTASALAHCALESSHTTGTQWLATCNILALPMLTQLQRFGQTAKGPLQQLNVCSRLCSPLPGIAQHHRAIVHPNHPAGPLIKGLYGVSRGSTPALALTVVQLCKAGPVRNLCIDTHSCMQPAIKAQCNPILHTPFQGKHLAYCLGQAHWRAFQRH